MEEGKYEYGIFGDDGWKIISIPKGFEETLEHLQESLKKTSPHKTQDADVSMERDLQIEHAQKMLHLALEAYDRIDVSAAWSFLTELAECVGFLAASQGAVHPRGDETNFRAALRKAGSLGGKAKGKNAQLALDGIADEIMRQEPPKGGWTKKSMRMAYNVITDKLEGFKDAERKWQTLLKRGDIQGAFRK